MPTHLLFISYFAIIYYLIITIQAIYYPAFYSKTPNICKSNLRYEQHEYAAFKFHQLIAILISIIYLSTS